MADAVIHRRPRRDRESDRKGRGQREHEEHGAPLGGQASVACRRKGAHDSAQPERKRDLRQFEREELRHIAARHIGNERQAAPEQFAPWVFEEGGEVDQRPEGIERLGHRPRPHQRHHGVSQHERRQQGQDESARARCRLPPPGLAGLDGDGQQQSGDRIDRPKATEDAGADREADAGTEQRAGRRRRPRIFLERAHQAEHQDRHRGCERRVLGVHIHVPVIERAGGEQHERQQPGDRPADPAAEPPGHRETDEADHRAGEPARLEQIEGQNLGEERGRHVEAAPIGIQVDEGQRPSIGESGAEQVEQQRAVLGVGVVVPAEAVIPERQGGDDGDGDEHRDGQAVGDRLRRPPPRRRYGHGVPAAFVAVQDWRGRRPRRWAGQL